MGDRCTIIKHFGPVVQAQRNQDQVSHHVGLSQLVSESTLEYDERTK